MPTAYERVLTATKQTSKAVSAGGAAAGAGLALATHSAAVASVFPAVLTTAAVAAAPVLFAGGALVAGSAITYGAYRVLRPRDRHKFHDKKVVLADLEYQYWSCHIHRVGVVGNLMKCPPGSALMRLTFERAQRRLHSGWHFGNRALSEVVSELGLQHYVRSDICNADLWLDVVRLFLEDDHPIPSELYFIHWINEFWRTVTESGGYYRGKKVLSAVPDKNNPKPGTALARLYAQYGL